ncbi:hypothetical protein JCM33374_g1670 [Metschnikowia sp. JCM 33374]|nr:hypothetical protein JCM33374_g1670 [Metschnikowia sp. JCM 33374]
MSTFNVVRYSLLGAGVLYGAVHRYNLESSHEAEQKALQWKKEEKLIKQAKAEYAKLHPVKEQAVAAPAATGFDFEDPNLDFGKVLESYVQKLQ